jgi:hypothetical protein
MIPHHRDFDEDDVEEGERIATSPITGTTYLVRRWIEESDGKIIAIDKEPVEEVEEVEDVDGRRRSR